MSLYYVILVLYVVIYDVSYKLRRQFFDLVFLFLASEICKKKNIERKKCPNSLRTRKFDWTPGNIRIEKISRFLEKHGPHSEFNSRSFSSSMPKEGSSTVIGERNYI